MLRAGFYFDVASPLAYLAAERVLSELPVAAEWHPVLSGELPRGEVHQSSADDIARAAEQLGLQPLRWPDPFPFDSTLAMRAATYAKSIGRVVAFAQAAFRQAFAGGHSLEDLDFVLLAAAACEMHPRALQAAIARGSVAAQLIAATAAAREAGVVEVPTVVVDGHVFGGGLAIERSAAHLHAASATEPS